MYVEKFYQLHMVQRQLLRPLNNLENGSFRNRDNLQYNKTADLVGQIYPTELQLNKANSSDTEAPFLDLNLSITNGIVSSKIYDKRDDLNLK